MNPVKSSDAVFSPTIRASILRPLLVFIQENPGKNKALLKRTGLSEQLINDPYAPVPLRAYLELFEDAASFDPLLGVKLGMKIRPGDAGPIGLLMAQSATIARGLQVFVRYCAALQTSTMVILDEFEDDLVLAYRVDAFPDLLKRQDSEFTMACICGLIRSCFDSKWRPTEVHFTHASNGNDDALKRNFGSEIRFNQSINRMIFNKSKALVIKRVEDSDLTNMIEHHLNDLIIRDNQDVSLVEKVKLLIRIHLGVKPVNLENIAACLQIFPRTLQRQLVAEGMNFRDLLLQERMRIATTMLHEGSASIELIAGYLGYADATVFWRAYKDYSGLPPTEERAKKRRIAR